jgi:hypothetical protein
MYTNVMSENTNPIKNKCQDIIRTKPEYRKMEIAYLRYMMRDIDQETLIKDLETLNIRELRFAIGAGVPGHAMHKANEILQQKKARMEAFIESDGNQAAYEAEYKTEYTANDSSGKPIAKINNDSDTDSETE